MYFEKKYRKYNYHYHLESANPWTHILHISREQFNASHLRVNTDNLQPVLNRQSATHLYKPTRSILSFLWFFLTLLGVLNVFKNKIWQLQQFPQVPISVASNHKRDRPSVQTPRLLDRRILKSGISRVSSFTGKFIRSIQVILFNSR